MFQEGIDASYFRSKARPSQTNSLLKNRNKKEDEVAETGNMQVCVSLYLISKSPRTLLKMWHSLSSFVLCIMTTVFEIIGKYGSSFDAFI